MRIGFLSSQEHLLHTAFAQKNIENTIFLAYQTAELMQQDLVAETIDAYLEPLNTLPTTPSELLVNAALLHRFDPRYCLYIHENDYQENAILSLKPNSVIHLTTSFEAAQLADYRTDLQPNYAPKHAESSYLAVHYLAQSPPAPAYKKTIRLDATEFVPPAAEGIFALRCLRKNEQIALELRAFNDPQLVAISNIERRIVQLIGDENAANQLGVYATCDQNEHYHATICYCPQATDPTKTIQYLKLSQSTRLNLAEALVKKLFANQ